MKSKTIKLFLFTFLMCLSSVGAWAQTKTITLADIDFSNSIVTSSSSPKYTIEGTVGKMTWDGQWTVTPYLSDGVLRFGNFTGTVNLADGIEQSNGVVTVSFDLAFGKLSKKQIGFSFLDSEGNYIIEQLFDAYNGDFNDKNPLGLDWNNMFSYNTPIQERCVYFTIIFDYNTSKITTKTKCYLSGTGRNATEVESVVDMTNTNYISSFRLYGNINNADRYSTFDNFKITAGSKAANYTINYITREGLLLKSETVESTTGSSIEISETQKTAFFLNDDRTIKYYYAEDDSEGKTVMGDGSTVVTIIVDEAVVATTIHDFEDENTIFTGRSRISIACEYNEEQGSNVCKFTNAGNAQNGYCFANYNIESLTKYANKVIINFDYKPGGRSYVTIGDASIRGNTGGSSKSTYSNIGAIFRVGMNKDKAQVNSINLDRNKFEGNWLNVNVEIDTLSKKVSYIIKQKSDGAIIAEGTEVDYYNASTEKCTQIDFFDYINDAVSYIDNITITTESIYVIQQLNYQTEDGTILKSDKVKSFGVIKGIPLVVKYDDSYYTLDDNRLSDYSLDVRSNYLDETVTVNYRHSPDVVFFREGESSQGTDARYSSGGSGTVAAQNKRDRGISVGTLPAGEYEFIVNIPTEETNKRSLVIRQSQNDPLASVGLSDANMTTGIKTAIFKLTEETSSLFINGANSGTEKTNLSVLFDYVMVKIKSVPLTITSAGVGTICSPYNLDFTNAENIAAYKAETSEDRINLTRVYNVAAREGVLIRSLNGGAVTEDIPVSATAFDANEGNEFIGTLVDIASQPSEDEEYRYYILSSKTVNGNKVYGFYLANNKKIGAGKAYLRVPLAAAAKYSFFSFDDETTGVEDIELGTTETDSPVYDLFGRKVVNPATGLYIKNGKKFIVK